MFSFSIHSFIGRMSKLKYLYGLEAEHFFKNNNSSFLHETPWDYKSQTRITHTRFEIVPESEKFCNKPTPSNTAQYPDHLITYEGNLKLHTGKRIPLQVLSTMKLILIPEKEYYIFQVLKTKSVIEHHTVCGNE